MLGAVLSRWSIAVAVLCVAALPPPAAADWLQWGGDAGHAQVGEPFSGTDVVLDARWDFTTESYVAGPIIVDRQVLFSIGDHGAGLSDVWSAGLDNASTTRLFSTAYEVHHLFAIERDLVLIGRHGEIERRAIDGTPVWSDIVDPCTTDAAGETLACGSLDGGTRCGVPAYADDAIYLACSVRGDAANERRPCTDTCSTMGFVQARDATTGFALWTWIRSTSPDEVAEPSITNPNPLEGNQYAAMPTHTYVDTRPMGATIVGGFVAATFSISWLRQGNPPGSTPWAITGDVSFLPRDGPAREEPVQTWSYTLVHWTFWNAVHSVDLSPDVASQFFPPAAATPDGRVAALLEALHIADERNLAQDQARRVDLQISERSPGGDVPPGLAWGDLLYVAHQDRILAIDHDHQVAWEQDQLVGPDEHVHAAAPIIAGGLLLVAKAGTTTVLQEGTVQTYYGGYSLLALDAHTGALAWELPLDGEPRMAASGGVLGILLRNPEAGQPYVRLLVLGTTPASPVPTPRASTFYPAPGQAVTVDLSGSGAGALGGNVTFRADWGDGLMTEWQSDPVLRHRYSLPQDAIARFTVRNDANQTGTAALTFHVGAPPPLNWIQQQFSSDNQERTFFVLGLVITLLIALLGILLARRRRNIVRRELDAMAAGLADRVGTDDKEAFLRERRARFMELNADRRIDEGQWALLERRADLHLREVRIAQTEAELGFLPHGLMVSLRRTLDDGKVTEAEYDLVLRAVEADDLMSPTQKKRTQRMLQEWRTSDLP